MDLTFIDNAIEMSQKEQLDTELAQLADIAKHIGSFEWKYDGDTIDRYLWRMKKEAQSDGGAGPNGFPMAHWFAKNYRRYFKYLHLYTGDIEIGRASCRERV